MNRITITTLLSFSLTSSALAAPKLSEALSDHRVSQGISAAIATAEEAERERLQILEELPTSLAAEFLVPQVSDGSFSGEGDQLTYSGDVTFSAAGDTEGVLSAVSKALGASRDGETICMSTAGGDTKKIVVEAATVPSLLNALGTSSDALEPSTHYLSKSGDSSLVIAEPILGSDLFQAIQDGIAALKKDEKLRIRLDAGAAGPGGAEEPVHLLLTTTDGKRLKLEVELDGVKKSAADSVPEGAVWKISGSTARVPFDKGMPGHIMLLTTLLKEGRISIGDIETVVTYPSHFAAVTGPDYTVELLGDDNAWFASSKLSVSGGMEVTRDASACSISVTFSAAAHAVSFGPLTEAAWKKAKTFRPVRAEAEVVDLGYLQGPACESDPAGITDDDFDEVMGRGDACQKRCDAMASLVPAATDKAVEAKTITDELMSVSQRFSNASCRTSCMQSKGYRGCIDSVIGIKPTLDFLNNAKICEDRRPQ